MQVVDEEQVVMEVVLHLTTSWSFFCFYSSQSLVSAWLCILFWRKNSFCLNVFSSISNSIKTDRLKRWSAASSKEGKVHPLTPCEHQYPLSLCTCLPAHHLFCRKSTESLMVILRDRESFSLDSTWLLRYPLTLVWYCIHSFCYCFFLFFLIMKRLIPFSLMLFWWRKWVERMRNKKEMMVMMIMNTDYTHNVPDSREGERQEGCMDDEDDCKKFWKINVVYVLYVRNALTAGKTYWQIHSSRQTTRGVLLPKTRKQRVECQTWGEGRHLQGIQHTLPRFSSKKCFSS